MAGTFKMVLSGSGSMVVGMIPVGIFVGVVLLIARSRLHDTGLRQGDQIAEAPTC